MTLGKRVVVTGMSGAGKSTFSKQLAQSANLPLVHVDLLSWDPGWRRRTQSAVRDALDPYLNEPEWIIDGNDQLEVSLPFADTLVIIDTPWWLCAWRAFLRGLYRPANTVLPEGCEESHWQRLVDEWAIVLRHIRRHRIWQREQQLLANTYRNKMSVVVLSNATQSRQLLDNLSKLKNEANT